MATQHKIWPRQPLTPIRPTKNATQPFSPCQSIDRERLSVQVIHINPYAYFRSAGVSACTTLVPSLNLVLNMRLAFWNMPSFKLTTMNCDPLNLVLINRPIFCVCDRSRAASTSSRMYMGAGLNWSKAMIRESAMSDLRTHS